MNQRLARLENLGLVDFAHLGVRGCSMESEERW